MPLKWFYTQLEAKFNFYFVALLYVSTINICVIFNAEIKCRFHSLSTNYEDERNVCFSFFSARFAFTLSVLLLLSLLPPKSRLIGEVIFQRNFKGFVNFFALTFFLFFSEVKIAFRYGVSRRLDIVISLWFSCS